jgi:surface polysaccharide O-acyltransferase-like enzyme
MSICQQIEVNRIESVDIFRFIAIIAVIVIHVSPFSSLQPPQNSLMNLNMVFSQLSRFAVPFFFIISGYFFAKKIKTTNSPVTIANKMSKRVLILFLFWSVVYLFPFDIALYQKHGSLAPIKEVYWNILMIIDKPIPVLFEGTKVHLWFLISLIYAIYITTLLYKKSFFLLLIAIFFYIVGVLIGSYSVTPVGLDLDLNARYGPLFSLLPFIIGCKLAKLKRTDTWMHYGFYIFITATFLHFVECYVLLEYYSSPLDKDFVFSTVFMGVGISLMALSNHKTFQNKVLGSIGTMTLGIYASHFIFIDLFRIYSKKFNSPLWDISLIIIVLSLSILLVKLMSHYKLTKKFVF